MWQKDNRTDEQVYTEIAQSMLEKFKEELPECEEGAQYIADEIFKSKRESDNAVHCFFSPSKSNGWVACPAYLDRSKQWDGSKEPAIRGTIVHHFLSKAINNLLSKGYSREFDWITALVFQRSEWLSEVGVESVLSLLNRIVQLNMSEGFKDIRSEVFLISPDLGEPNKNLRFGGSIDVLCIKIEETDAEAFRANVHIYDLKTGKNIVKPDCTQLKCYSLLVRDLLLSSEPNVLLSEEYAGKIAYCKFTLGIAQNGKVEEFEFHNVEQQAKEFMKIKRAMNIYNDIYLRNNLNVEINGEVDSGFSECFNPCPYCRFCRGCYKRDLL